MSERRGLALIILFYLLAAGFTALRVPLGEAPDELDHFLYVAWLIGEQRLPVMRPSADENVTMEANQPPLAYALYALATAGVDWQTADLPAAVERPLNPCFAHDSLWRPTFYQHTAAEAWPPHGAAAAFYRARLLSTLLGAATVWLTAVCARQLGRSEAARRSWALGAAALVACNPQFIYITASVNNDVLAALLGALMVALSVRLAADAQPRRLWIGLGATLAAALLTKLSLLALFPAVGVAVIVAARRDLRSTARRLPALVGLPLLLSGWWYLRNWRLYGDPLVWDVHLQAKGPFVLRTTPFTSADLLEFARIHFQSYWAWFGWLNIQPPEWVYAALALFVLIGLLGWLPLLWKNLPRIARINTEAPHPQLVAGAILAVAVAGSYAALLRYIQTINWSGYQGRLAYAAIAPTAVLLATGWRGWLPTRLPRLIPLWMLGSVAILVGVLWRAYDGAVAPPLAPAVAWRPICAAPTADWEWEFAAWDQPLRPGAVAALRAVGYGAPERSAVAVRLLGANGAPIGEGTLELSRAGRNVIGQGTLRVAPDAAPQRASLTAEGVVLTAVKVAPAVPPTADPAQRTTAVFGQQLALLGYTWERRDGQIALTLYWQAVAPPQADYTRFVHLLDADGQIVAQDDRQPDDGRYPTGIWDLGEVVLDRVWLPDAAEGVAVGVGWYQLAPFTNLTLPDGRVRYEWELRP